MIRYAITTPFSVTDEEELYAIAKRLQANVLTQPEKKFILSGDDLTQYEAEEKSVDAVPELQKILPAGEALVIKGVGGEEERYLAAFAVIVTPHEVIDISLDEVVKSKLNTLHEAGK